MQAGDVRHPWHQHRPPAERIPEQPSFEEADQIRRTALPQPQPGAVALGSHPACRCRDSRLRPARRDADRLQHIQAVALARPQFLRQHRVRPAAGRAEQSPDPYAPTPTMARRRSLLARPPRVTMPNQRHSRACRAATLQMSQNLGYIHAGNLLACLYGGARAIYNYDTVLGDRNGPVASRSAPTTLSPAAPSTQTYATPLPPVARPSSSGRPPLGGRPVCLSLALIYPEQSGICLLRTPQAPTPYRRMRPST